MERRLGRGLQSLISSEPRPVEALGSTVSIEKLAPNPRQPRDVFDDVSLERLAESIRRSGILQPIVVRKAGERLEIIAGERRWRAAKLAGLREVPVAVRENLDDGAMLELALLENVQRVDLNAIEKARGYRKLLDEFGRTQEEIALSIGQDRATVANTLRLLELAPEVQDAVQRGSISAGHARALLSVPDLGKRRELFERLLREDLSVRDVEVAAATKGARRRAGSARAGARPAWVHELQQRWEQRLGVRVRIDVRGPKARVTISCGGLDELDRVTDLAVGLTRSAAPRVESEEPSA